MVAHHARNVESFPHLSSQKHQLVAAMIPRRGARHLTRAPEATPPSLVGARRRQQLEGNSEQYDPSPPRFKRRPNNAERYIGGRCTGQGFERRFEEEVGPFGAFAAARRTLDAGLDSRA